MRTVMNLVRESKAKKVSKDMVWKSLLKQRWSKEILGQSAAGCLNESEQHEGIVKAAQELSLTPGYKCWVPEDDLAFGFKLFSIVHYCPTIPAEAAKLSFFFGNHRTCISIADMQHKLDSNQRSPSLDPLSILFKGKSTSRQKPLLFTQNRFQHNISVFRKQSSFLQKPSF